MYLYKLYDAADEPLYVGITKDPEARFQAHRSKPWWKEVARRDLSEVPDDDAATVERIAIRRLAPKHNVLSHPDHPRLHARTHSAARRRRPTDVITAGKANTRYGMAADSQRVNMRAHLPAKVFVAWRDGHVVAITARWKCGKIADKARLSNETGGYEECTRCLTAAAREDLEAVS